ncbi:MAG: hypothetical protein QOJ20_6058 [Mycobacterium sp.]|jgi:hypothetical protein|nr:hypothetical protein [Mycobacterium sp.]
MNEPIHITIQGDPDDPRFQMEAPPGIIIHRSPPLHPDDVDEVRGIPVTSLARTLVDLAEPSDKDELRWYFTQASTQDRRSAPRRAPQSAVLTPMVRGVRIEVQVQRP